MEQIKLSDFLRIQVYQFLNLKEIINKIGNLNKKRKRVADIINKSKLENENSYNKIQSKFNNRSIFAFIFNRCLLKCNFINGLVH